MAKKRTKSGDTYQGPNEGFRGEVTRASLKALKRAGGVCPSCGATVPHGTEAFHVLDCIELRADVADTL